MSTTTKSVFELMREHTTTLCKYCDGLRRKKHPGGCPTAKGLVQKRPHEIGKINKAAENRKLPALAETIVVKMEIQNGS